MQRKVCIATGTRAEWGLLSAIARQLQKRDDIDLQIIATNMHLSPRYGMTVDDIIADGFIVNERVPMLDDTVTPAETAQAMAMCLSGTAKALERLTPHVIVILGDRYEMLAVAAAANLLRVPVIHLHGGEISEGAIDDNLRHAITKMSSLHLTATEQYRQRVIQMGEEPERVIHTGAIGVYNATHEPVMPLGQLEKEIGFEITPGTLLVTLHPATLDNTPVNERCLALLEALNNFPLSKVIITYPNNDPEGLVIIGLIEQYAQKNPGRVKVIPSLGKRRYLSALHYVCAVVGNSSSGVIEVPSMGIPSVNIGCRQRGRTAATSVIHCEADAQNITKAIAQALSPQFREKARLTVNPYYKDNTLDLIVNAIATTPLQLLQSKHFHDLR